MADQENTTKDQENIQVNQIEDLDEDSVSLESLDALIADSDPEFLSTLQNIGPDEPGAIRIYEEGVELEYTYQEEKEKWSKGSKVLATLSRVLPFLPYISYQHRMILARFRLWWLKKKVVLKTFAITILPRSKALAARSLEFTKVALSGGLSSFRSYSLARKLTFASLMILSVIGFFLVSQLMFKPVLDRSSSLFINSLTELSGQVYKVQEGESFEPFYDSPRIVQNIFMLKKMIVNLKPSQNSGATPMAALEFYVEGTVNDVAIEIKDREAEIEDLFLRTIEEMNYDQISSGEGKVELAEALRKEANRILVKGQIRRVYYKTAIIKP